MAFMRKAKTFPSASITRHYAQLHFFFWLLPPRGCFCFLLQREEGSELGRWIPSLSGALGPWARPLVADSSQRWWPETEKAEKHIPGSLPGRTSAFIIAKDTWMMPMQMSPRHHSCIPRKGGGDNETNRVRPQPRPQRSSEHLPSLRRPSVHSLWFSFFHLFAFPKCKSWGLHQKCN